MTGIEERLDTYRNRFRLEGKIALVLGAASGIGRAAAEALAALGATVICADKKQEGVETTASEIAAVGRAESHVVDAGDADAVQALAATIDSKHNRLDIAVSTPAVHVRKLMLDYKDEEYDQSSTSICAVRSCSCALSAALWCVNAAAVLSRVHRSAPARLSRV